MELNSDFKNLHRHVYQYLETPMVSKILDDGVRQFARDYIFNECYSREDENELRETSAALESLIRARLKYSENYLILSERLKYLREKVKQHKGQMEIKTLLSDVLEISPNSMFVTLDSFSRYIDSDEESQLSSSFNYKGKVPKDLIDLLARVYDNISYPKESPKLNRISTTTNMNFFNIVAIDKFMPCEGREDSGEDILKKCSVFFSDGRVDTLKCLIDHPILSTKKYIKEDYFKAPTLVIKEAGSGFDQVFILSNSEYLIPFNIFQDGVILHGIFEKEGPF